MTARTIAAVKMFPPPDSETFPSANNGNHPRLSLRNLAIGWSFGARTKMPHSPKTMDGTAASRSMTEPKTRETLRGAYCVMNSAMNTAIGTAMIRATTELSSVTTSKSRIPK